jgi:hypothetical protein
MTTEVVPSCSEHALAILREPGAQLYGVIDAAHDLEILALIQEGDCPFECLFQGESAILMASVAPYLIQFSPEAALLEQLVVRGWGNNWGIYVRSRLPLDEVRRNLRHFTMVELPGGQVAYFRFHDPRVFGVFITTCNESECRTIFEGLDVVFAEETDGTVMKRYRLENGEKVVIDKIF